jgi:murein DD-endopeptidase MepM/ murein hydrolase activator NlpD
MWLVLLQIGDQVFSATDGIVTAMKKSCKPGQGCEGCCEDFGNFVRVKSTGLDLLYCHLSKIYVKVNDQVTRGQLIGTVGVTGFTLGPHLHMDCLIDGKSVDGCKHGLICEPCSDCSNCGSLKKKLR